MSLLRWQPHFNQVPELFDEFNRAMGISLGGTHTLIPALNAYQTENDVVVEASLPGIDHKDINISVENDVLTIKGSTEKRSEVDEKDYFRQEVRIGGFHRAVALPVSVKTDEARAVYEKGVLKITIPKEERAKPKTIKVETASE